MKSTETVSPAELVAFSHQLADASATAIAPYFRSNLTVVSKGGSEFDPVTEADRTAEAAIRSLIEENYPDHGILGEEHGSKVTDGHYRWVIDPIDGTRAFITGLPTWGTLIGLEFDDSPAVGMMNQPYTNDRFWSDGESTVYRGPDGQTQTIRARRSVSLPEAQMAATDPNMFMISDDAAAFERVLEKVKSCRYGTDCFGYALLAAGFIDLVVECMLKPYDIVALIPIIENAGGVITNWDGSEARFGGRIVAAANGDLHAQALELLNQRSS